MKEVAFIRQNIDKWREAELLPDNIDEATPDELGDAYVGVSTDLAYARSHYPDSRITVYLNRLAGALHNELYKYKREPLSRLLTFWTREVPLTLYAERRSLLASLAVFVLSVAVGVVSQLADADFARLMLGDFYVDMTLNNIAQGVPTGVYGSDSAADMFVSITFNNVKVAFLAFALGLLTCFATGLLMVSNGIMVGTFQTLFFQHGVGLTSMLAIWLHGTLEISSIVVAGAAGFVLGSSWLMPGTYSRLVAFRRGAMRGLKVVVATVPLFVVAAFIEGYLTRHAEWPDWQRASIIAASLLFVLVYYVLMPLLAGRRQRGGDHAADEQPNTIEI